MNITIPEAVLEKIMHSKNGKVVVKQLLDLTSRENTEYHRGALHGFLLALTRQDIITGDEAIDILEQLRRN